MNRAIPWKLIVISIGLLLLGLLAAGQAVTFAWLSAFPDRAEQIESLQLKFWAYVLGAVICFALEGVVIVRLVSWMRKGG